MSVSEYPILSHPGVPLGTFVIISLDPMAYVAPLKDAIATQAAAAMRCKKYLALIDGVGTIDFSRTPLRLKYDYRLVGLGFPRKDRGDKPGALFSIPVAPTAAHPTARTPLHPSKALPWEDCYLHTLIMVSAAVSRIHHDRPTNACIPEDELYRIIEDITEDEFTARPRPAAPPPAAEVPVDYSTPWSESTGSEVSHEDSYDVYDDGSEEEDGFEVPHYEPFVEIWEDLGVVDAPADPEDIRSELDELYRIGKEWLERKTIEHLAKRPQTYAWAANVANATASSEDDPEVASEVHREDNLAPEDAIDERLAQLVTATKTEPPSPVKELPHADVHVGGPSGISSSPSQPNRLQHVLNRIVRGLRRLLGRLIKASLVFWASK